MLWTYITFLLIVEIVKRQQCEFCLTWDLQIKRRLSQLYSMAWWSLICVHTVVKMPPLRSSCQLKRLKSGFSALVPWWMLRWLHTFWKCLFLATFGHVFISSLFPLSTPFSHSTICMGWEKKNTIGQNHQQHHYDVLFYKEPHWQPVFFFFFFVRH